MVNAIHPERDIRNARFVAYTLRQQSFALKSTVEVRSKGVLRAYLIDYIGRVRIQHSFFWFYKKVDKIIEHMKNYSRRQKNRMRLLSRYWDKQVEAYVDLSYEKESPLLNDNFLKYQNIEDSIKKEFLTNYYKSVSESYNQKLRGFWQTYSAAPLFVQKATKVMMIVRHAEMEEENQIVEFELKRLKDFSRAQKRSQVKRTVSRISSRNLTSLLSKAKMSNRSLNSKKENSLFLESILGIYEKSALNVPVFHYIPKFEDMEFIMSKALEKKQEITKRKIQALKRSQSRRFALLSQSKSLKGIPDQDKSSNKKEEIKEATIEEEKNL